MNKRANFIFSNQYAGYLFIDIVNVFANEHSCELLTGHLDPIKTELNQSVKTRFFIRYNKKVTYKRIFTWLVFTVQVFFRLLFIKKDTELFLATNPPLVPFIGYLLNKLRGIKYHLVIYDIYPDALVNFSFIKKGSFINRIWSKLNCHLFKNANTIYTLSENMARFIKISNPAVKVEVIHNWTDTSLIRPVEKESNLFAKEYKQTGKITVMYSGNMGSTHAVEKIVDLADAYKNHDSFGFILIGDGAKKAMIEQMKKNRQLENLLILPYQSPEVFPYSISCADLGIVTLSVGAEDLSVPSKTYNLLAAGVALLVIASPASELARLVQKYNCGVAFEEHETEKIIAFLREVIEHPGRLKEMKENARKASHYFTPANARRYKTFLNSNVEKKGIYS